MTDASGFDVGFNTSGSRDFLDLPRTVRRRIRRSLEVLRRGPRAEPAALLWGEWEGFWRLRVGEYRVIYEIDDRLPEGWRVDDRNALNRPEAQEVGISADEVVGAARDRALEELIVFGIATQRDAERGRDQSAPAPEELNQRDGLDRGHVQLAEHLRATHDIFDFGEDLLGEQQGEAATIPGRVDSRRDSRRRSGRAPQDDLSVKDGLEHGPPEAPRR